MTTTTHFTDSPPQTRLGSGMAWWVWILAVTFVVYLFSFQTGYSIVNPSVQKDASLTVSQVATIAAVYTWVFAICQFFGGALLDRMSAIAGALTQAFGLVGLNGIVVKSHGGTDATGFASAVDTAYDMASSGVVKRLAADVARFHAELELDGAA